MTDPRTFYRHEDGHTYWRTNGAWIGAPTFKNGTIDAENATHITNFDRSTEEIAALRSFLDWLAKGIDVGECAKHGEYRDGPCPACEDEDIHRGGGMSREDARWVEGHTWQGGRIVGPGDGVVLVATFEDLDIGGWTDGDEDAFRAAVIARLSDDLIPDGSATVEEIVAGVEITQVEGAR